MFPGENPFVELSEERDLLEVDILDVRLDATPFQRRILFPGAFVFEFVSRATPLEHGHAALIQRFDGLGHPVAQFAFKQTTTACTYSVSLNPSGCVAEPP